jgi:hypothetical protein
MAWLERLFPHGVTELPALSRYSNRSFTLNALAQSYQFLVSLAEQSRSFEEQSNFTSNIATKTLCKSLFAISPTHSSKLAPYVRLKVYCDVS